MENFLAHIRIGDIVNLTVTVVVLTILLYLNHRIFSKNNSFEYNRIIVKNSIAFFLIIVGTLVFIAFLPLDEDGDLNIQLIKFFGAVTSAAIALSATTVLGNLIAGFMNNSMKRFRNGVIINIGDIHGMVIRKNTFHTEIQLEDSNYLSIPNLFIARNPVKLTRKSNTIISTSVSLGYDVSRTIVEDTLKDAAKSVGLTDPYVYITSLGDFSVAYKIHGFLGDSSKYFSTSSLLNGKVLDKLHAQRIEIVSPIFMNQRLTDAKEFIPDQVVQNETPAKVDYPEELIFEEAIKSENIEKKKDLVNKIDEKIKSLNAEVKTLDDDERISKIKDSITRYEGHKVNIQASIAKQTKEMNDSK